jgi:hypothetical protein
MANIMLNRDPCYGTQKQSFGHSQIRHRLSFNDSNKIVISLTRQLNNQPCDIERHHRLPNDPLTLGI